MAFAVTQRGRAVGWCVTFVSLCFVWHFLAFTNQFERFLYHRAAPGQHVAFGNVTVFVKDMRFNHPLVWPETVSTSQLVAFVAICGATVVVIEGAASRTANSVWHAAALFMVAVVMNEFFTLLAKNYVGFLRPNFYNGCGWSDDLQQCTRMHVKLRHSFPSGHSSHSWNAAVLLTLRVLAQYHRAGPSGRSLLPTFCKLLVPVPCAVAGFIALSRVHDFWHHPADVVAGTCCGATIAALINALAWIPDVDTQPRALHSSCTGAVTPNSVGSAPTETSLSSDIRTALV